MILRPTVSLHGSGESVTLSNQSAQFTLMNGISGLGVGPQALETADLASGGSILRHRRTTQASMEVPILLGGDYYQRRAARRLLERLCADQVEVRVTEPNGESRSRFGYYQEGLEGGNEYLDGQKLVLSLLHPDPWWYGRPREIVTQINSLRKPLISADVGEYTRRNLIPNPGLEYGLTGFRHFNSTDAQVLSTTSDAKSGVSALRVDVVEGHGTPHVITPRFSSLVGSMVEMAVEVKASPEVTHVVLSAYDADSATDPLHPLGASQPMQVLGEFSRVGFRPPATRRPYLVFQVQLLHDNGSSRVDAPPGSWAVLDEFIAEVGHVGTFFDGDTPDTEKVAHVWEGPPDQSPSVRKVTSDVPKVPFFPVILSDSTIHGAHVLEVQGDAEVWPTWTISGPGEDLLIQNDSTGDRIFLSGKVDEQVTVVTRPQEQDVFSPSSDRGGLWDRVSLDSVLFPLQPGENRIRLSMVNSKPASSVRMSYRERYRAGH